jgi:hypothetical protein
MGKRQIESVLTVDKRILPGQRLHLAFLEWRFDILRSVQLDSWTIDQLRVMKLGGNEAATQALKGVSFKDVKSKYTSRQMLQYKERLNHLVLQDQKK